MPSISGNGNKRMLKILRHGYLFFYINSIQKRDFAGIEITSISDEKINVLRKNILPNVILNRFDIKYGNDFDLYRVETQNESHHIAVHQSRRTLELSLYMHDMAVDTLIYFIRFLFDNYGQAQEVRIRGLKTPIPGVKQKLHLHINLPESTEKFDLSLSHSIRYNLKRYTKKIRRQFGEVEIKHFSGTNIPKDVVTEYFRLKKISHGAEYSKNYIDDYFVTDCYVMRVANAIASIVFIVDTPPNVYLENLTYNPDFAKYSVGTILCHHVIHDLVNQRREQFYLLDDHEYKRHFNSIGTQTYSCTILRRYFQPPVFMRFLFKIYDCIRKITG
jgi:hypothetical protein